MRLYHPDDQIPPWYAGDHDCGHQVMSDGPVLLWLFQRKENWGGPEMTWQRTMTGQASQDEFKLG